MEFREIIVYLLIVGAALAIGWLFCGGEKSTVGTTSHERNYDRLPTVFRALWSAILAFEVTIGSVLSGLFPNKAKRYAEMAEIAALPLTAERVFAASALLGSLFAMLGLATVAALYVAVPSAWVGFGVLIVVGFFLIGWFWAGQDLAHYAELRQERMTRELPFAIDLIGGAMRSGLDFGAAMRYYTNLDMEGPLREEFSRVLADVTLGRPFVGALEDMSARIRVKSFASFVSVVSYGMEIGAPVAESLRRHGEDLRKARFNLAERKAARAPAVMILPLVLFVMPSVFIVVLTPMFMRLMPMLRMGH
jgi:tight adherence protein C